MSYSITVKFSSEDEAVKMIDFLKQEDVVKKIKPFFDKSINVSDQYFYPDHLDNGGSVSVYAPKDNREKFVSSNASQITPKMFQLYIWMANLSTYREKDKAFFYYDSEKVFLLNADNMTKEEIENTKDVLCKNGCHYKRERGVFQKIIGVMSGEYKDFDKFNEVLIDLKQDYAAYTKPKIKKSI